MITSETKNEKQNLSSVMDPSPEDKRRGTFFNLTHRPIIKGQGIFSLILAIMLAMLIFLYHDKMTREQKGGGAQFF